MEAEERNEVAALQTELKEQTRRWACREGYEAGRAGELRERILLLNHRYYADRIPAYRRLAEEAGAEGETTVETIARDLVCSDDIFKSYRGDWLDARDFERMTAWLRTIYHADIDISLDGVETIDHWIERLWRAGIHTVYSSGTSGTFSFIPRDKAAWDAFLHNGAYYLLQYLIERGANFDEFDAALLGFRGGHMGIQLAGTEIAKYVDHAFFLYDEPISAELIRLAGRGPRSPEDLDRLKALQADAKVSESDVYGTFVSRLKNSLGKGRKIWMFGAPFQLKALGERLLAAGDPVTFTPGSIAIFGGGWKTFEGERINPGDFLGLLEQAFGIPGSDVIEVYSMVESNCPFARCPEGNFHISPLTEPIVYDEALVPMSGEEKRGTFGFLDPFASSYPGFLISGDSVHFVSGGCGCGLEGPFMAGEVARAPGREARGCAGVMASIEA